MTFYQQKFVLTLFCFLVWGSTAMLAQRQLTGKVTDAENGEALIGASVMVSGTTIGSATDFEGNYRLIVPADATTLRISYTGYAGKTIDIGTGSILNITLAAGLGLEETVIIGYGKVKREDATGLVQSVSADRFNKGAITGPQELLAGKVAGVVITTDGSPGGGSKIRVRGESSLTASNNPLIVVDGIPLDNGGVSGSRNQLNIINPNDIESITVLKDASAAAIYGNRASGGVIIITTKKGRLGKKIQLGYNANVSFGQTANRVDVLTADEFRSVIKSRYATPANHPAPGLLGTANTDWQDEIYQIATGQDHSVNVSGGIGNIPYRVSLGYTDKNGLLKTDKFSRYSSAVNLNPGFFDNTLQVNFSFKGMLSDNHFADKGAIGNALSFDPTKPVRDTSSRFGGYTTWKTVSGNPNSLATTNPIALLELKDDNSTVKQYLTNFSLDYRFKFLPALRANLNLGYDYTKGAGTVVTPTYAAFAFDAGTGGGVNNKYEQVKKNSVLEAYLNYKKEFGDHVIDLMGGYSWQHFYVNNYFRNSDAAGIDTSGGIYHPSEFYLLSLFGRFNYTYHDRFLFTGSLRRDGTSRFAPDYRWGIFPAAALAVKVIDNDKKYLNSLKIRTSWGITGQQDIGDYYAYLARYQFSDLNAQYQFGDQFLQTIRPNAYVEDIKWEETTTYNAGIDFSLVKDRVSGSFDAYLRKTKDLLNFIPVSALSNLSNYVTDNIGTMETKGVELNLTLTPIKTKLVTWDLSTNFAYNRSTITKLTTSDDPSYIGVPTGGIAGGVGSNIQIHTVGYSPYTFYVKEQIYDEAGNILEGKFVNLNGDTLVNDKDKYHYKNPAPLYTIGITNSLSVGHFNLSFAGRANIGQYVYNNVQTDMGYLNRLYGTTKYLANVNQSAVDLNVVDQANLTFSDHFITKASFFRIDHITLGYNFEHLVGKYFYLYTTVQNPFVITEYKGLDPEIENGIDNNIYPRPRTLVVGLSVNF